MTAATQQNWKKDFGLDARNPPHFFSSVEQLDDAAGKVPQPHALRRAFEQLGIDGVLCQERSPVIYFRQVRTIVPAEIISLHRSFWNQGIAPILVIITPEVVHVYSGLIPPDETSVNVGHTAGFVETLTRVQDRLRSFLLSVESGEYFHIHRRSFDPRKRVDQDLLGSLQATRQELGKVQAARLEPQTLDALLCRLVFTCYLFDRGIIDQGYLKTLHIQRADHLKDILSKHPRVDAKADLYKLFDQLGNDFNGDLFSADLEAESRQIKVEHLDILDRFFHGTDIQSGQQTFWPYDFSFIPIETISAIYEHFLKAAGQEQKKEAGAFYTPRFLAEFVLDVALQGETSLLAKRYLDPACGSGIFLVGLFNRLAEEWKLKNAGARYDRRATGLMDILRTNLYGVDSNRSACQITAFSLYLAFLDQLSPPDIQKLLGKWERLPHLVSDLSDASMNAPVGTIRCADFFTDAVQLPHKVDIVIGNPPWGNAKDRNAPAVRWCVEQRLPQPYQQMATAFIWKAPFHLDDGGKVCFLLPHGTLFNHKAPAIIFQKALLRFHAIDVIFNLADYQRFLFQESEAPAIGFLYRKRKPADGAHQINYWAPKTDWRVTQAEIISIQPTDRSCLSVREVLNNLNGADAPSIWKAWFWATPRDRQLLDRLSLSPRLQDLVGSPSGRTHKRWVIGQGFEERATTGQTAQTKTLTLPTTAIVEATSPSLQLFLLRNDCTELPSTTVTVRKRSNTNTEAYFGPHVLITKGFSRVAFADFDVCFRHALRGIHGAQSDRDILIFLTAYLRSDLARYFLFHTSSNWGVTRAEVHVEELLRLPFPLPQDSHDPKRCQAIIREIAAVVTKAADNAAKGFSDRAGLVRATQASINKLIDEYFDVDPIERVLIKDTADMIIPSVRPSRAKPNVPTIKQSSDALRASYTSLLCDRLNGWAKEQYMVHAKTIADSSIGVGMVVLEKTRRGQEPTQLSAMDGELLRTIDNLQQTATRSRGTFELVRGVKVFDNNLLYVTKPLGQRFWTNTAALNDADEIAATILTRLEREGA